MYRFHTGHRFSGALSENLVLYFDHGNVPFPSLFIFALAQFLVGQNIKNFSSGHGNACYTGYYTII